MILRLAVLVQYQRVTDGQTDTQTNTRRHWCTVLRQCDKWLMLFVVIQMLQNLQQKLVAQQQQQQQRQLHELLLQLLAVHKLGTGDSISPPLTVGQQESPVHVRPHGMCSFSVWCTEFVLPSICCKDNCRSVGKGKIWSPATSNSADHHHNWHIWLTDNYTHHCAKFVLIQSWFSHSICYIDWFSLAVWSIFWFFRRDNIASVKMKFGVEQLILRWLYHIKFCLDCYRDGEVGHRN